MLQITPAQCVLLLFLTSALNVQCFEWISNGDQKVFLDSSTDVPMKPLDHLQTFYQLNHTFDDLNLYKSANRTLKSSPYLHFERFSIMNVTSAAYQGFLSKNDTDCATSSPNALFSRPNDWAFPAPSMFHSNADSLSDHNISQYFDFISFDVKPMGPVHKFLIFELTAYEVVDGAITNYRSVYVGWGLVDGFQKSENLEPRKYFPGWGRNVNWVEATATIYEPDHIFGEGEPGDFCLDNIVLQFHNEGDGGDDESLLWSF